jgi:hypothetical protein
MKMTDLYFSSCFAMLQYDQCSAQTLNLIFDEAVNDEIIYPPSTIE